MMVKGFQVDLAGLSHGGFKSRETIVISLSFYR